jgi:hypothetical protein
LSHSHMQSMPGDYSHKSASLSGQWAAPPLLALESTHKTLV